MEVKLVAKKTPLLALVDKDHIYEIRNPVNKLVKMGFLEVSQQPDPSEDLDAAIRRFARILQKEFPEDWKEVKVEWKKNQ